VVWAPNGWCRPLLALALLVGTSGCCDNQLPSVTGLTLAATDVAGNPDPEVMARTLLHPPIPLILLRPGSDPLQSAMPYNHPRTGAVAARLAVGVQSFLLMTPQMKSAAGFVVAVFLDNESTPALSAVVGDVTRPLAPSSANSILGIDGKPRSNNSALAAQRRGYRVNLARAAYPLPDLRLDLSGPWTLHGDNVADAIGVLTLQVEPAR
jgi:hypothetical protein